MCELSCAIHRFGSNNPKKASIRFISLYPHPVVRMPVVCKQCKGLACRDSCPTGAITVEGGIAAIDDEKCVSC
ncbi:MAG: hypothetical protein U9N36_00840 [Euryarchaeota archaeon]|nr:hypothetical protein [Euryarchaeota archaeon]